jgi:ornithine cyclodeaminase/alanine dehydrogenase-like protein (mu-crystallin family)
VSAVDSARAAVQGADIVGIATNSVTPVVENEWVAPHAHVTCVKELELGDGILEAGDSGCVYLKDYHITLSRQGSCITPRDDCLNP